MSAPTPPTRDGQGPRTERWATLTPDALEDEIEANRRGERWTVVASGVGLAATALAVVLQAVTR